MSGPEEFLTDAAEPVLSPRDPVARLLAAVGYSFRDPAILQQALTHRSFVNECADPSVRDNERFEFLGDRVIDLVISAELMRRHPEAREGPLSRMRALLVSEGGLARVAESIGLGDALRLGRGEELSGGRKKPSILSDAFEAFFAAVYLDGGLEEARRALLGLVAFPGESGLERGDPKTELQQRIQAQLHITPTYRLIDESGPDHEKRFGVQILVGERILGHGEGRTKKEAEQRAAAQVLDQLDAQLLTVPLEEPAPGAPASSGEGSVAELPTVAVDASGEGSVAEPPTLAVDASGE